MDFPRNLRWFFRNCWRYRKHLWNFRTWDWFHNYDWFMDTWRDSSYHLRKHNLHEDVARDTKRINAMLRWWGVYHEASYPWPEKRTLKQVQNLEELAWDSIHKELYKHSRAWWD